MINKNFSDYNLKSTKLLGAWINRDNNSCYLHLTYKCIDKNGNEYMVVIPKICLPCCETCKFQYIPFVKEPCNKCRKYDKWESK